MLVVNGQLFGLSQEDLRMVQSNELAQIAYYESLSAPVTIAPDTLNIVQPLYIRTVKYQESSGNTYLVYSKEYAVTGLLQGGQTGGSISYGQSQAVSETLTANVSLSASYKDIIVATLGVSYTKSAENSSSFGMTINIGAGKTARIMFVPMMRHTNGVRTVVTEYNNGTFTDTYNVSGIVPQKVRAYADGLYYPKYQ